MQYAFKTSEKPSKILVNFLYIYENKQNSPFSQQIYGLSFYRLDTVWGTGDTAKNQTNKILVIVVATF